MSDGDRAPDDPIPRVSPADPAAHSGDVVADNIATLKALFPAIAADGKVDFDVLRQLLGDEAEAGEERYGLDWKGKKRARAFALTPSLGTLRPAREESRDWESTRNIMIEGDNLEVLKLLRRSYAGKVKLIYIDPPYNTGTDRIYPDDYRDSIGHYERLTGQRDAAGMRLTSNKEASGRYHTDWLNMMYPRLIAAKDLLREDGIIAISTADYELDNLLEIVTEIFGRENRLALVSIVTGAHQSGEGVLVQKNVEYCLLFSREAASCAIDRVDRVAETYRSLSDAPTPFFTRTDMGYTIYFHPQTGDWKPIFDYDVAAIPTNDPALVYTDDPELIAQGYIPVRPGFRRGKLHRWRWSADTLLERADEIVFRQVGGEWRPSFRQGGLNPPKNVWNFGGGTAEVADLMGKDDLFQYPKGLGFMRYLVQLFGTRQGIVLDFFAGSGTTAHAVIAQNAEDGGERRYILVQLPEPLDPDDADQRAAADFCDALGKPRTIAELTKERLRRAGDQVRAARPDAAVDTGFRVYKLATSNLKPWQPDADDLEASLLDAVDNVLPGRGEQDLLVELLLKTGIDLTLPSQTRTIAGAPVHALGGGVLIVCLADIAQDQAEPLGEGIADWREALAPPRATTFYFRDSGFANAAAKANLAASIRQRVGKAGVEKIASI